MIIIDYTKAFKALNDYVDEYNATVDKSKTLKSGMVLTAQSIMRIYGMFLIHEDERQAVNKNNLPPLKTNNAYLAVTAKSSSRTIYRHIKRLMDAGIVTRKELHSNRLGYSLWINEKLLLTSKELSGKELKGLVKSNSNPILKGSDNQLVKDLVKTKRLPREVGNKGYINNIIIDVDNHVDISPKETISGAESENGNGQWCSAVLHDLKDEDGNKKNGNTGEKVVQNFEVRCAKITECDEDTGEKVPQKRAESRSKDLIIKKKEEARGTFLNFYVAMLWSLAKNVLYKDVYLTARQQKIAQELIYRWYEPVETEKLADVHQVYIDRIVLAYNYVSKDKENRFIPFPYQYFDPDRTTGFRGTKAWYYADKESKRKTRVKIDLQLQIRRFNENEKRSTAEQLPRIALLQESAIRLTKIGGEALAEQFYAKVITPHNYSMISNNQMIAQ